GEGGTNLVLMEYMACGRPAIASYSSGHKDVVNDENAVLIRSMGSVAVVLDGRSLGTWDDPDLDETIERLEWAYQNRDRLSEIGKRAGQDLAQLSWKRTAQQFHELLSSGVRPSTTDALALQVPELPQAKPTSIMITGV